VADDHSGEDALIARYFKPLATDPGAFGLDDDAAVLEAPHGEEIVVTTDAIVEGVHFLADDPPDTVARKALRVNLSDLAAKGAQPAGFVLTLALRGADDAWLTAFARGLGEDAKLFDCPLLGGDTVSTPGPLTVSISAFGRVPAGKMVHRTGARPGDRVMVSGTIGDAALGLHVLKGDRIAEALAGDEAGRAMLVARYRVPQPRDALAAAVREFANAAMLALGVAGIETLVSGGDDYEILCTVTEARLEAFAAEARRAGVALTSIGTVIAGAHAPRFLDEQGSEIVLKRLSFSHF